MALRSLETGRAFRKWAKAASERAALATAVLALRGGSRWRALGHWRSVLTLKVAAIESIRRAGQAFHALTAGRALRTWRFAASKQRAKRWVAGAALSGPRWRALDHWRALAVARRRAIEVGGAAERAILALRALKAGRAFRAWAEAASDRAALATAVLAIRGGALGRFFALWLAANVGLRALRGEAGDSLRAALLGPWVRRVNFIFFYLIAYFAGYSLRTALLGPWSGVRGGIALIFVF
ncbi:hypothetical protein T492DRAFT_841730 [Pavlovales sp. CCMP2436]|nr:hypothetical protein T492DRAFT_841730 [Pavlovales sp. CCMP2436]